MDYFLSEWVLGHVRLKPVEKIKGVEVSRMFKETHKSDREDLIKKCGDMAWCV